MENFDSVYIISAAGWKLKTYRLSCKDKTHTPRHPVGPETDSFDTVPESGWNVDMLSQEGYDMLCAIFRHVYVQLGKCGTDYGAHGTQYLSYASAHRPLRQVFTCSRTV